MNIPSITTIQGKNSIIFPKNSDENGRLNTHT
jgi:hypothetical protein